MRKFLILSTALATLTLAMPAYAQSNADAAVGGTAGGVTGGTIGFLLGGPIGAIIGGWSGAVIGASAAVSDESIAYVGNHPVDPVYLDATIDVGFVVPADIEIHAIEGDDQYGYFYADNRVWIVDLETREVVQSPGFTLRNETVAYVEANPVDDIDYAGDIEVGVVLDDIEFAPVPEDDDFLYAYIDGRPVLVDAHTHTVVWLG